MTAYNHTAKFLAAIDETLARGTRWGGSWALCYQEGKENYPYIIVNSANADTPPLYETIPPKLGEVAYGRLTRDGTLHRLAMTKKDSEETEALRSKLPRYKHRVALYAIVDSNDLYGDDITPEQLRTAFEQRIDDLNSSGDLAWTETALPPTALDVRKENF